jgi:hypothetical protein
MNSFELDSSRLDTTCKAFADEFQIGEETVTGRQAYAEQRTNQGILSVNLTYRSPEQQQRNHDAAMSEERRTYGNPSAFIDTYRGSADPRQPDPGVLARPTNARLGQYKHDRDIGLVVVNDYKCPTGDTRPLDDTDERALDGSIATGGMYDPSIMRRALTTQGIFRLILMLEQFM